MKKCLYDIKHVYQPTNDTCGYAALAILLSHYGTDITPAELVKQVPQPKDSSGVSRGSSTSQLAGWTQAQGFRVHMYASDMFILDLSWRDKNSKQIKQRLEEIKSQRTITILDDYWAKVYEESYITMLSQGVDLTVVQFIDTKLINKLLSRGPIYANISSTALRGKGRSRSFIVNGQRSSKLDDVNGRVSTHSTVIYGCDGKDNYLVADPWAGLIKVNAEHLVLAIEAAQIECDNQIFIITN
jgi:hypothetical protein